MKPCENPYCVVVRQALDDSVARAERLLKALQRASADVDAIVCSENDTRHDMGLPPKEDE